MAMKNILKRIVYALCMLNCIAFQITARQEYAVVVTPVLDLGDSPSLVIKSSNKAYDKFSLDGGKKNGSIGCPRMHQLIYHEIVQIKKKRGSDYEIEIPNIFYITHQSATPKNDSLINKKHLITFTELKNKKVDLSKFPDPISFDKKKEAYDSSN